LGENNPRWNGGKTLSAQGYILKRLPDYWRADNRGYVREHIYVWEQHHGKHLPRGWEVHHINGIKTDNRPENLLAMEGHKHKEYIPALQERIRELEQEIERLRNGHSDNTNQ